MRENQGGAAVETDDLGAPKAVWKRSAVTPRVADSDVELRCGGPEYTRTEKLEMMRQRLKEMREAEAREREEAEAREAAQRGKQDPNDEEDEDRRAERERNNRYSVTLLKQDDSAWGGGGADSGMLG